MPGKRKKLKATFDIDVLLDSFSDDCVICWVDGACRGNPGPASSGCFVEILSTSVKTKKTAYEDHKYLSASSTNGFAEVSAIELALDMLSKIEEDEKIVFSCDVYILTDSTYAHGIFGKEWKASANLEAVSRTKLKMAARRKICKNVKVDWVSGHSDVVGNERADELANMALDQAILEGETKNKSRSKSSSSSSSTKSVKRSTIDISDDDRR